MSAVSMGSLMGAAANGAQAQSSVGIWRCTFDVDDLKAKVGRRFGDGSLKQSLDVIEAIVATAKAWAKASRPDGKMRLLTANMIDTLEFTLRRLMDFKTGAIEATYEMIAAAAGYARGTIHRHLVALRELGWLDWVRRSTKADDGSHRPTANAYFFEISRLPLKAQIHLRQLLKRKGVLLEEHAGRHGSGPVPNRIERLAERLAKGFTGAVERFAAKRRRDAQMDEAAFVRAEMALLEHVSTDKWAEVRHPGDLAAQAAYSARMGIPFFGVLSPTLEIHTPVPEQG